jgi:hypothetical protein
MCAAHQSTDESSTDHGIDECRIGVPACTCRCSSDDSVAVVPLKALVAATREGSVEKHLDCTM